MQSFAIGPATCDGDTKGTIATHRAARAMQREHERHARLAWGSRAHARRSRDWSTEAMNCGDDRTTPVPAWPARACCASATTNCSLDGRCELAKATWGSAPHRDWATRAWESYDAVIFDGVVRRQPPPRPFHLSDPHGPSHPFAEAPRRPGARPDHQRAAQGHRLLHHLDWSSLNIRGPRLALAPDGRIRGLGAGCAGCLTRARPDLRSAARPSRRHRSCRCARHFPVAG